MNNAPTVLEIDSGALIHNYSYFKSKLDPDTRILTVIKAFAYGTDPKFVAQILEELKVDYLAVAYTEEGVFLRKAGIDIPILILHPQTENFSNIITYNLEPNIYSFSFFEYFVEHSEIQNLKNYPVHIKINSGMNRLGFKDQDIKNLLQKLSKTDSIHITSVYSHLAASEDPKERDFTLQQIDLFKKIYKKITLAIGYKPLKHISNTSGILNYPEAEFDMVRLGIGLYGFANDQEETKKLRNVCNLKSKISQIQQLKPGETVSYNRKFKADKPTKIAVIPIGYADGISRGLSCGKGSVLINNCIAPIAGTVCMDIIMADITGIDCNEGDEVIIFNTQDQILELAKQTETIPYEIIATISQRIRRKLI